MRRFLTCVIVSLLILSGSYVLAQQPGGAEDILGFWENVDPEATSLIYANFRMEEDQLVIHAYGACDPEPCDWGEAPVILYSTSVTDPQAMWGTAEYEQGFAYRRLGINYNHGQDLVTIYLYSEMRDARYNYRTTNVLFRSSPL